VADSPAVAAARATLAAGLICTSFLWPLGGRHAPEGHARITVLPAENLRVHLARMVLVSPPGDLRGLTPRELEFLGLLIEGWSNAGIAHAWSSPPCRRRRPRPGSGSESRRRSVPSGGAPPRGLVL
jgi:hypothetical protein